MYEAVTEGVHPVEATNLIRSLRAAHRIAKSMANRVGCAVVVRHHPELPTVDLRIKAQRVIKRYVRTPESA